MEILILTSTLFVIGSVAGWIIELLFRRIFTQKKWMNPGFLVGPYLPIYGFGVLLLYGIMSINFNLSDQLITNIIKVIIIAFGMTLIELISGLIFIKGMKIKLWDYSDRWGNFKGIICPLFSFLWLIVGAVYAFFINPYLVEALLWVSKNLWFSYVIGVVIGAILVDCAYSLHLGLKIRNANENAAIRYDEFKLYIREKYKDKDNKKPFSGHIISNLYHALTLNEQIKEYREKNRNKTKWWKRESKPSLEESTKEDNTDQN